MASVYVPPSETLNELAFDRMIKSFSSRYLVLGDFNGHSYLWGAKKKIKRMNVVRLLCCILRILDRCWHFVLLDLIINTGYRRAGGHESSYVFLPPGLHVGCYYFDLIRLFNIITTSPPSFWIIFSPLLTQYLKDLWNLLQKLSSWLNYTCLCTVS